MLPGIFDMLRLVEDDTAALRFIWQHALEMYPGLTAVGGAA
jgi:hypothetical protein